MTATVTAKWLAPLPGDAFTLVQPVWDLQGATQGTADSTGHISIPDVVLLGTAGTYNLSVALLDFPQVCFAASDLIVALLAFSGVCKCLSACRGQNVMKPLDGAHHVENVLGTSNSS